MTEFISRKYGNDGYEVIIKTDCHEHYKASEEFARRLIDHAKHMTNADRIRAMSDEKLAKEVIEYRDDWGDYVTHNGIFDEWEDALKAEIEWLQQPAEVE